MSIRNAPAFTGRIAAEAQVREIARDAPIVVPVYKFWRIPKWVTDNTYLWGGGKVVTKTMSVLYLDGSMCPIDEAGEMVTRFASNGLTGLRFIGYEIYRREFRGMKTIYHRVGPC